MPSPPPPAADRGAAYEDEHVHAVYDAIAPHFSATRYKPWPIIERFLQAQPPGSLGLDAGCGNGKYATVQPRAALLLSDRSAALTAIAAPRLAHLPGDALQADSLALPHPTGRFDFALSIAVVHHLSTRARRVAALAELLRCVRPGCGRALVFVWALEQAGSRRGWAAGDAPDVLVPWVTHGGGETATFQRYYHLYSRGELEDDIAAAGGAVVEAGYERDNWWAIAAREHGGMTHGARREEEQA